MLHCIEQCYNADESPKNEEWYFMLIENAANNVPTHNNQEEGREHLPLPGDIIEDIDCTRGVCF